MMKLTTMMAVTLGPKEDILRTHSTVNMAVKIRLRSASTSENSRGAPWNCKQIYVEIYVEIYLEIYVEI